jgi:Tfp pilus assembly protein PilF
VPDVQPQCNNLVHCCCHAGEVFYQPNSTAFECAPVRVLSSCRAGDLGGADSDYKQAVDAADDEPQRAAAKAARQCVSARRRRAAATRVGPLPRGHCL